MKYILWDFNGTVLDDAELCYNILCEMLTEEERPSVTYEEYLRIFTFPVRDYYAKVYDLEKTSFEILAHRFIERYQPRSLNLHLHDHIREMVCFFEDKGFINVLLSASEEKNLFEQLDHFKIRKLFKYILGTSNIYAKSKVDVAKDFIQKQGIKKNDMIMIGDTLHDAEVAHALGCEIILYTKGHQHKSRLLEYPTIDDFRELKHIIK